MCFYTRLLELATLRYFNYSDGDTTTKIPDWIYFHWKHTSEMKEWTAFTDYRYDQNRQCTTVGFLNRGSQITAADCAKEVADVVCQPKKKHP